MKHNIDTTHKPEKRYDCPYAKSVYCEKYSKHMNEWAKSIEYLATHRVNFTFFTAGVSPVCTDCDVYKMYSKLQKVR